MNETAGYLRQRIALLASLALAPALAVAWSAVVSALNRSYGHMVHRVPLLIDAVYVVGVVFAPLVGLFTLIELGQNRTRLKFDPRSREAGLRDTLVLVSIGALLIDLFWIAFVGYVLGGR